MKNIKFKSTIDAHLDVMQARLDALSGSSGNCFLDNIWLFADKRGYIFSVDFNELLELDKQHSDWKWLFGTKLIDACKFAWIGSAEKCSVEQFRAKLFGLATFLNALDQLSLSQLTLDNLPRVLDFVLMHSWANRRTQRRATLRSAVSFWRIWCVQEWKTAFSALGIEIISASLHFKIIYEQVKQTIPRLTEDELSFADWMDGGTFNHLTLDYGQYFIEHCLSFFDKNIAFGQAVASTLRATNDIARECAIDPTIAARFIRRFLIGHTAVSIFSEPGNWLTTPKKIVLAYRLTVKHFEAAYEAQLFSSAMLKHEILAELLLMIGIQVSLDNIDRFRVIVWFWLRDGDQKQTEKLLRASACRVSTSQFTDAITSLQVRLVPDVNMPSIQDYLALGLDEPLPGQETFLPAALTSLLQKIGITCFVALTGWRRGEYGFSMQSVDVKRNKDLLDQNAFPYRYSVIWRVPKTGGEINQEREITFETFLYAAQMSRLLGVEYQDKPCLYPTMSTKKDIYDSSDAVYYSLRQPWRHFALHYEKFKELDRLKQEPDDKINFQPRSELALNFHPTLVEAWRRCRAELSTIEFHFTSATSADKINWLLRYVDGTLRKDWISLINDKVSSETKDWIFSLDESQLKSGINSRYVSNEIISECLYPTPHALRHMWVEAVYRRYDGDVGWMIRSQFKHISRSMWLRYVRDKDNWSSVEAIQRRVVSSLVYNRLLAGDKNYAGQMNVFIRRLELITNVKSPAEVRELSDRIAEEIVGITTHPWGYCLIKSRTLSNAQCAEFGTPATHNASPELCLSCTHNLMQPSNIDWILQHVSTHVALLNISSVPKMIREKSYELVRKVARHVRALNPQHEALAELEEALADFLEPEAIKWF